MSLVYKLALEFENDESGNPAHPPVTMAITKNVVINSLEAAVAYCMAPDGIFVYPKVEDLPPKIKKLTRIKHKDNVTGEYFNIIKCVPVADRAFREEEAPRVKSLDDAPKQTVA